MSSYRLLFSMFALVLAVAPLQAQAPTAEPTSPPTEAAVAPLEIGFIGASISAGYGSHLTLAQAFDEVVRHRELTNIDQAKTLTFMDVIGLSSRSVDKIVERKPAVVVGLDFLFWYVYGYGKNGYEARAAELKLGLAQLERFKGPLFVGDIPLITDASLDMLGDGAIPEAEVLKKLNADLAAWAAKRDNVTILPVGRWLDALKGGTELEFLGETKKFERSDILLHDNLHLTRTGVMIAAALVAETLQKGGHLEEKNLASLDLILKNAAVATSVALVVLDAEKKMATSGDLKIRFAGREGITLDDLLQLRALQGFGDTISLAEAANPFVLADLPEAIFKLEFFEFRVFDGESVTPWIPIEPKVKEKVNVVATLVPGGFFPVVVVDADDKPVEGAWVASRDELRERGISIREVADIGPGRGATDATGAAEVRGLRPGDHTIYVKNPGESRWRKAALENDVTVKSGRNPAVRIKLGTS